MGQDTLSGARGAHDALLYVRARAEFVVLRSNTTHISRLKALINNRASHAKPPASRAKHY